VAPQKIETFLLSKKLSQKMKPQTKYIRNEIGEFICPHCQIIEKNQSTMHYHMKKHEGGLPHECKHCKHRFLHLGILNLHLAAKHADKEKDLEQERFKCPHDCCEFSSLTKANRRVHYFRVHMKDIIAKNIEKNDDKYTCKACNKELNSQTSMYYHIGACITIPSEDVRTQNLLEIMA